MVCHPLHWLSGISSFILSHSHPVCFLPSPEIAKEPGLKSSFLPQGLPLFLNFPPSCSWNCLLLLFLWTRCKCSFIRDCKYIWNMLFTGHKLVFLIARKQCRILFTFVFLIIFPLVKGAGTMSDLCITFIYWLGAFRTSNLFSHKTSLVVMLLG